jgi:hypothetical protein
VTTSYLGMPCGGPASAGMPRASRGAITSALQAERGRGRKVIVEGQTLIWGGSTINL